MHRRFKSKAPLLIAAFAIFVVLWIAFSSNAENNLIDSNLDRTLYSPQKLYVNGSFRPLEGNTIITFFDATKNPLWQEALIKSQNIVKSSKLSDVFAMLPPSSFHITVFDLLTEKQNNKPDYVANVPFWKVEEEMINRLRPIFLQENKNSSNFEFSFKNVTFGPPRRTMVIELDSTDLSTILNWRGEITLRTGIHLPKEKFHLTLAYQRYKVPTELEIERTKIWQELIELWQEVVKNELIIKPSRPRLTFFRDMTKFSTTPLNEKNVNLVDF